MTMHDKLVYDNVILCHICNEQLGKDRVRDHCHMLKICDIYASDYSIVFNASKSKCTLFSHAAISLRHLVLNQSFVLIEI